MCKRCGLKFQSCPLVEFCFFSFYNTWSAIILYGANERKLAKLSLKIIIVNIFNKILGKHDSIIQVELWLPRSWRLKPLARGSRGCWSHGAAILSLVEREPISCFETKELKPFKGRKRMLGWLFMKIWKYSGSASLTLRQYGFTNGKTAEAAMASVCYFQIQWLCISYTSLCGFFSLLVFVFCWVRIFLSVDWRLLLLSSIFQSLSASSRQKKCLYMYTQAVCRINVNINWLI